jgi:hypothetical protein
VLEFGAQLLVGAGSLLPLLANFSKAVLRDLRCEIAAVLLLAGCPCVLRSLRLLMKRE